MNHEFDDLTKSIAQSAMRNTAAKKYVVRLASLILTCIGFTHVLMAQTSLVCDQAGDAAVANGKANGSPVPSWLDIDQAVVTAGSDGSILFTLRMNEPVPAVPAWSKIEAGGQLTWGWRLIGKLDDLTTVRNGCIGPNGAVLPACYYLDLTWSVETSSFAARLLDNTSCTQVAVPFAFSAERTQMTLVLARSLLANQSLIPDPDNFEFLAVTVLWNSDSMNNNSYHALDWAPDRSDGPLVSCAWSAFSDSSCSCP